jgi:1,4-alpha-glucan branching enzyme
MLGHPGKKLLFMGGEFGVTNEWNHDAQLDWGLLDDEMHAGLQRLARDCNRLYSSAPALYELDAQAQGFEWIDFQDASSSVLAFSRRGRDERGEHFIFVMNATPVVRTGYRLGTPRAGTYREVINTDSHFYGGSDVGNGGEIGTQAISAHGRPQSLLLTLPPLAVLVLVFR